MRIYHQLAWFWLFAAFICAVLYLLALLLQDMDLPQYWAFALGGLYTSLMGYTFWLIRRSR